MTDAKPPDKNSDSSMDAAFYDLVEMLTDQCQQGRTFNLDEIATQYPQYADRLANIVPTLQWIGEMGLKIGSQRQFVQGLDATLFGNFLVRREIGRGGMGIVYEADQISLTRTVALKILPFAAALPERQIQRFKHEARAAACLQHPHIVPVYEFGVENGIHFYTMQYIEGKTLADDLLLQSQNALHAGKEHWNRVAQIGIQIADALDYAHELGIIHRDIKPANLLVDLSGKVWLADFGLAQLETETALTMTGDILGTLRYMSPEQVAGKKGGLDSRTDTYSLGITLYELLTQKPAFDHPERIQLLRKVLESEPTPPRKINPNIPIDLETILLKAISKDPMDRYPSAKALGDDLRRFLSQRPPLAMRPTWSTHLIRWSKRHIRTMIAAIAFLLLLTVGLSVATALVWRAQGRAEASRKSSVEALQFANQQKAEANLQTQNATRLAVNLALDRGLGLCSQGELAHGLMWLSRALELTPKDQLHLQSVIRMNIHDWSQRLVPLISFHRLSKANHVTAIAIDSKSQFIAVALNRMVHIRDLQSSETIVESFSCRSGVTSLAFSHDAKSLLIGTVDGMVQQRSISDGGVAGANHQHGNQVHAVAFGANGKVALSAALNEPVHFWDPTTGQNLGPVKQEAPPEKLSSFGGVFSPDAKACVTWTGGMVKYWDVGPEVTFRKNLFETESQTLSATISHDGKKLLIGRSSNAVLCEIPEGTVIGSPMSFLDHISAVAFDPQDRFCLVGSRDRKARLYQTIDQLEVGSAFEHDRSIEYVAFDSEGDSFYTVCEGGLLKQWVTPKKGMAEEVFVQGEINRMCFTSDTRILFAATHRPELGKHFLQVIEVATGSLLQEIEFAYPINILKLSHDGAFLITAGDKQIYRWDIAKASFASNPLSTSEPLTFRAKTLLPQQTIHSLEINPETSEIAVGVKDRIYQLSPNDLSLIDPPLEQKSNVYCLRYSKDGKTLFAVSESSSQCWDLTSGRVLSKLTDLSFPIDDAELTEDGQSILLADIRGRVFRHDLRTGIRTTELLRQTYQSREVAFHPDGKTVVMVGGDGKAQILDIETGRPIGADRKHFGTMAMIAFARNSRTIATLLPPTQTNGANSRIHIWSLPQEASDTPEQITLDLQVSTGMELDKEEVPSLLTPEAWQEKKNRL